MVQWFVKTLTMARVIYTSMIRKDTNQGDDDIY